MKINSKAIAAVAFTIGGAVGSLITWRIAKYKYEKIAQEEIDSVKETFSKRAAIKYVGTYQEPHDYKDISIKDPCVSDDGLEYPPKDVITTEDDLENIARKKEYECIISKNGYFNTKGDEIMHDRPYVISPDIFGDNPDYNKVSLTLYSDGVLTDEDDHVINPGRIDDLIGEESLEHFGEYEEDSVFVRNEARMTDYEILLNMSKFLPAE